MQYFVIWPDGQKFGPADLGKLNEWAAEGRITPETELESVIDGSRVKASTLPGMVFPGSLGSGAGDLAASAGVSSSVSPVSETVSESVSRVGPEVGSVVGGGGLEQQAAAVTVRYFVIGSDGSKYGPADAATLTQWAAENRLTPTSELENESTGQRMMASAVSAIVFPMAAAGAGSPLASSFESPSGSFSSPAGALGSTPVGSGAGYAAYPRAGMGVTDEDLRKFNWGAFLLNWIWGLNHKYPLALIALGLNLAGSVPVVGILFALGSLGYSIYLGIKGNEIAWNSGRFASAEEMHKCQRIWATWGVGLLIAGCVCGLALGILAAVGAAGATGLEGR